MIFAEIKIEIVASTCFYLWHIMFSINVETILTSENYLNLTYLIWLSYHSFSVVRFPVDEPALASTTTQDRAKDLCASELYRIICMFKKRHYAGLGQ